MFRSWHLPLRAPVRSRVGLGASEKRIVAPETTDVEPLVCFRLYIRPDHVGGAAQVATNIHWCFRSTERAKEEGGAIDEFRTAAGEESTVQNKTASNRRAAAARPESVITDEERIRALKEIHARALERTGKGAAKRTMRLSSSAKRSRRKGR
jgi:hypothetical protein